MNIAELYGQTLKLYNKTFDDDIAASWEEVLGRFQITDVEKAIKEWKGRTDFNDFTHRPMGSMMPMPADLAQICERAGIARTADDKFRPCGNCQGGHAEVCPHECV